MEKTLLIPTDFSIESLNLLKKAMQSEDNDEVHIVFFHCLHHSDSIVDLIFHSKDEEINSLVNEDFNAACKIIKNKYSSSIKSDRIEIFSGRTQAAFENFVEGNGITEIIVPKEYQFKKTTKRSFNPMPFIRKCKLPVLEASWQRQENIPEKNSLAELFHYQIE